MRASLAWYSHLLRAGLHFHRNPSAEGKRAAVLPLPAVGVLLALLALLSPSRRPTPLPVSAGHRSSRQPRAGPEQSGVGNIIRLVSRAATAALPPHRAARLTRRRPVGAARRAVYDKRAASVQPAASHRHEAEAGLGRAVTEVVRTDPDRRKVCDRSANRFCNARHG